MRSATSTHGTILGLIAAGGLLAGCGHDGTATATETSRAQDVTSAPALPPTPDVPSPAPVDPAVARASFRTGVTQYESGDYAGAAASLKIGATTPSGLYLLGLAQWKSGDVAGAEASLAATVGEDPSHLKGWINLARVRHDLHDRKGALEASDKALALDPTSADALHQRGRALMELKRGDEALDALKTAHDLDPDNGHIANTLGLLLIQTGRPGDAIEPLQSAKAALPHIAYVRNNLGVAYERTGRLAEAKVEYQAAVDAGDMGGKAMMSLVRLGATDTTGQDETPVVTAATEPPKAE